MATNPQKSQKKKERHKAKRKARRREMTVSAALSLSALLRSVERYPILDCCLSGSLFDEGIGYVLVSREGPQRQVATAVFLVDVYCLGVKNAFVSMMPRSEYEHKLLRGDLFANTGRISVEPAEARKLIEDAVDYADGIGLSPHADYSLARKIFGEIDPTECDKEFVFGSDGKPLFISGPHDTPSRCHAIADTLAKTCGPDGFHFIMPPQADGDW